MAMDEYRAGICNIGRGERRKRYVLGVSGFASAGVGVWKTAIATPLEAAGIFILLFLGFEGIYQGWTGFCAAFGHLGIYDLSENGSEPEQVDAPEDRREDQRRALHVHAVSLAGAAATMGALIVLTH